MKFCVQSSLYDILWETKFQIKTRQYSFAKNLECYGKNFLKIRYLNNKDLVTRIFFISHRGLRLAKYGV